MKHFFVVLALLLLIAVGFFIQSTPQTFFTYNPSSQTSNIAPPLPLYQPKPQQILSPTVFWNQGLLQAAATTHMTPPEVARGLALLNLALYRAQISPNLVADSPSFAGLALPSPLPQGFSAFHSQNIAARFILDYLFPDFDNMWRIQLEKQQNAITENANTANTENAAISPQNIALSENYGQVVAQSIFRQRVNDGSADFLAYAPNYDSASSWKPTFPYYQDAMKPHWQNVKPFLLASPSQFRSDPPPAVDSAIFQKEREEVYALGGIDSATRTADQTQVAHFWADGKGTFTPPGHWAAIALHQLQKSNTPEPKKAEIMAKLSIAMADTAVAVWDSKYFFDYLRPVHAVRQLGDETWQSLIESPNFPEYPSGHSAFGAAAATILSLALPDSSNFTTHQYANPARVRNYEDFWQAANESAQSRIYGGIHFASARDAGLDLGKNIANLVWDKFEE